MSFNFVGKEDFKDTDIESLEPLNWKDIKLETFNKVFYKESTEIKNISDEEIDKFRNENEIKVFGKNVPKPITKFEYGKFPDFMINSFKEKNFEKPTPIQSQCWPICLQGKDLIGLAETGSGKTLGFLLPGIIHLLDQPMVKNGEGPIVLVLAPTRELAKQIEEECNKFIAKSKVKTCCLYGGAPKYEQKIDLKKKSRNCNSYTWKIN